MDNEKIQALVAQLKGVGLDDEKILDIFYEAFEEGKMDRKDLETLAESLGYELDDDFKEDKTPDPIENPENGSDISESEAEDLKEIKPGESKEEFKEKIDEAKDDMESDEDDKKESDTQNPNDKNNNSDKDNSDKNDTSNPSDKNDNSDKDSNTDNTNSDKSDSGDGEEGEEKTEVVWVSGSGTKYHSTPNCSNMKSPRELTIEEAERQNYTPCSKCYQ